MKEFEFHRGSKTVKYKAELLADDTCPKEVTRIVIDAACLELLNEILFRESIIPKAHYHKMKLVIRNQKDARLKELAKELQKRATEYKT